MASGKPGVAALAGSLVALMLVAGRVSAQTPAYDPSEKLRAVLPADVAERVLGKVAEARARDLPAAALEHRAVELAAKGVAPEDVERGVARHAVRLERAHDALTRGGRTDPTDIETEAAEVAITKGVDGAAVSELAKSAPSGASLAVPLMVLAAHLDRGLPSDQALARVHAAMVARAAERSAGNPSASRPASPGRPDAVPANGGRGRRPPSPQS